MAVRQDRQAHIVAALSPDLLLESRDGLEVVIEDLGLRREDAVDQIVPPVEVGGEDFDRRSGPASNGVDASAEVLRAAIGQVVAGDRRDDDVPKPQSLAGLGEPLRLVDGDDVGPASLDRAEAARSGADVAQNHERRRSPGPALGAIRAAGALADRLEPELLDEVPRE